MVPDGLCLAHREQDSLREAFKDSEVAFVKGEGLRSEDLEQSDDFAFVANGRCGNGPDLQMAADFGVNPGVRLAIVTTQGFGRADTFSGESGVRIYAGAERRATTADTGSAHHGSAIHESYCCARTTKKRSCTLGDDTQCCIQIGAEGMELVLDRTRSCRSARGFLAGTGFQAYRPGLVPVATGVAVRGGAEHAIHCEFGSLATGRLIIEGEPAIETAACVLLA